MNFLMHILPIALHFPMQIGLNIKKWVDINEYKYVCIKLVHNNWKN